MAWKRTLKIVMFCMLAFLWCKGFIKRILWWSSFHFQTVRMHHLSQIFICFLNYKSLEIRHNATFVPSSLSLNSSILILFSFSSITSFSFLIKSQGEKLWELYLSFLSRTLGHSLPLSGNRKDRFGVILCNKSKLWELTSTGLSY